MRHLGSFQVEHLEAMKPGQFNYAIYHRGEPNNIAWYFDNLRVYDEWDPARRILIYYEDMITEPAGTFERVISFLGDSPAGITDFMSNYNHHKQTALKMYDQSEGSQTQGNSTILHSQKLSKSDCEKFDQCMKASYQHLWDKYLGHRYSEEALAVRSLS